MNSKNRILTGLLAGAAVLSSHASAAVLFSDDFSSLDGGTGWAASSTWTTATNGGTRGIVDGAMVLTKTDSSNSNTFRALATPIAVTGADFWFVANYTYTGTRPKAETFFGIQFTIGDINSTDNFIGANTGATNWRFIQNGNTRDTSPATAVTSSLAQVVMHFTESRLDMWVNPADTSSALALGTAHATYDPAGSISGGSQWDGIRFLVGHGSAINTGVTSEITVDNMTAATTFAEAIPEPSTSLLTAFAASALLLRRRRS